MKILLILGSMVIPITMFMIQKYRPKLRNVFNMTAILAALVFGNITSLSIYQVIKDNTVLMTNIHAVFLNPFFLLTGSYIGVYIIYRLLIYTLDE